MTDQSRQDRLAQLQQLYESGVLSKELYHAALKGLGLDPAAPSIMEARLQGAGAVAQDHSVAAGAGGVAVGGDFHGNVYYGLPPDAAKALEDALCDAVTDLDKELIEDILHFQRTRPEEPYRYLYSFDTEHMTVFKGRDTARKVLLAKIRADRPESRLTLLHSPSGAGKTSLLRAGIVPELAYDRDYLPVYVDHPREPVSRIKQVILPKNLYPEEVEKLSLQSFLKAAVPGLERKTLVILLDQFEEFFIQLKPQQRQPFIRALADCYHDRDLPVKFVLSMRKEYYANMTEFDGEIKTVFANYFSLGALIRDEAKSAIEEPLKDTGMAWEPGAVETLLNYLDRGKISSPHLQLICSRLYEQAKNEERTTISVEGVSLEEIHANFLTQEMKAEDFPPHQRELGWRLLKELVTSERTKQVLSLTELYEIASRYKGASGEEVDAVLERLVNRRVLRRRRDEIEGETLIELAHDTLAKEIDKHRTDQERREKDAHDLVERELATWRQYKREPEYLMGKPELMLLDGYRQDLVNPGPETLEFLFRSALAANHNATYWFTRAEERGVAVKDILKERLESGVPNTRAGAATALGELRWEDGIPWLAEVLEDDYTHVRARAREALLKIGTPQALQILGEHPPRGMIYIPAGKFIMGEDKTYTIDLPAFYIGKHMVTNAEYEQFVKSTGYHSPHHWVDGKIPAGKEDHPVVDITWFDALEYARWAGMRLPTEAEWEKAARGTDGRRFPWGDEFDPNKCNVKASNINHTTEVGANSPDGDSPYGCTDMAGNVWQWTSSLIWNYPYDPDDGREDLKVRDKRVIRGASYSSKLDRVPVAYRNDPKENGYQERLSHNLGFRCALSPVASLSKPK